MNYEIEVKLGKLLIDHKITYKELQNRTGLSLRTISELANNKMERLPKKAICKIAEALEIEDIREIVDFKK